MSLSPPTAAASSAEPARSIADLRQAKAEGQKIVAVTCYDAAMARLMDVRSVDMVLVGDSVGMVMHGDQDTLKVKIDHMVMHTSWVSRVLRGPWLVADMPFMSTHISLEQTMRQGSRLIAEGGAQAVKLEGASAAVCQAMRALTAGGIPTIGHLGYTPQSIHQFGGISGYRRRGSDPAAAAELMRQARLLEDEGAVMLVLEMVPTQVAAEIAQRLAIPVIGIGAGAAVDGQILVLHDLLGMNASFQPKFVKRYAELERIITEALSEYAGEVRTGAFPSEQHSYNSLV